MGASEALAQTSVCAMGGSELSFALDLVLELVCSCSCLKPDDESSAEGGSILPLEVKCRWVLMILCEPRPAALEDCPWPFSCVANKLPEEP